MKYMILTFGTQEDYEGMAGTPSGKPAWSGENFAALGAFMQAFNQELVDSGELVETRGLSAPVHTRRIGLRDGVPVVTDGPYAEAEEVLAGYWVVDCESFDRATEIAARLSQATDWRQIVALYEVLLRIDHNPVVALNHAVAIAMVRGPATALDLLAGLEADTRVNENRRFHAVRAYLLEQIGDRRAARESYEAAASRATNLQQRRCLNVPSKRRGCTIRRSEKLSSFSRRLTRGGGTGDCRAARAARDGEASDVGVGDRRGRAAVTRASGEVRQQQARSSTRCQFCGSTPG